jgi:hypothetical protein
MRSRVRRTLHSALEPDALWREVLAFAWLGDDVDVDLRPGGSGSLVDDDGSVRWLVIDEIGSSHVRLRWRTARDGPSRVDLVVVRDGDGARLEVTEVTENAGGARFDAAAKGRRWEGRLQALAERVATLLAV